MRDVYPLSFYPYWTQNTAFCVVVVVLTLLLAVLATAPKFDASPREVARTTMSQPTSAYGVGARTKYPRRDTTPPPQPQMPAPAMAPIPQLQQPEPPPQVAPVVQQAREALMAARAKANEAAGAAANPPPLPNTPAHNLIGFPLREVFHAYTPAGEDIVPIRLEIDGAALEPPVERRYTDTVLWNARDSNLTPEIFASVTVDEIGLPDAFAEPIATQIRQAIREHLTVPDAAAAAGAAAASPVAAAAATTSSTTAEKIVTLDLHVTHESGIELRDRVLWDVAEPILRRRPCAYVRRPQAVRIGGCGRVPGA